MWIYVWLYRFYIFNTIHCHDCLLISFSPQVIDGEQAMNVQLSIDETYADVLPVRIDAPSKRAFVSIMRGNSQTRREIDMFGGR